MIERLTNRILLILLLLGVMTPAAMAPGGCGDEDAVSDTPTVTQAADTATARDKPAYIFAVAGDSHTDGLDNGVLSRIVEDARARGASFLIHTGDVTNIGSREEFEKFNLFAASAGMVFHPIPGNHDLVATGDSSLFEELVGPSFYGFDVHGDHFMLLNNADEDNGIDAAQMEWLIGDLEANSGKNLFVFAHAPVGNDQFLDLDERGERALAADEQMVAAAIAGGDVRAFFFGHLHGYFAYDIEGIDTYISGGAGAPLYPLPVIGFYNYMLVRVDGDEVDIVNMPVPGR